MSDATLRLLENLRAFQMPVTPGDPSIEAFARLIAAPSPAAADPAWLHGVVAGAACATVRAEVFRAVFAAAEAANAVSAAAPVGARTTGALALEGLLELPARQRALLALSCVLGFTDGELGHVIDASPRRARALLDQAVDAVRASAESRRAPRAWRAA